MSRDIGKARTPVRVRVSCFFGVREVRRWGVIGHVGVLAGGQRTSSQSGVSNGGGKGCLARSTAAKQRMFVAGGDGDVIFRTARVPPRPAVLGSSGRVPDRTICRICRSRGASRHHSGSTSCRRATGTALDPSAQAACRRTIGSESPLLPAVVRTSACRQSTTLGLATKARGHVTRCGGFHVNVGRPSRMPDSASAAAPGGLRAFLRLGIRHLPLGRHLRRRLPLRTFSQRCKGVRERAVWRD
jgi:hypothetical protein